LKILIIGGTRFLGRLLVITALVRGHRVTLFNRGKSNPDLFPEIERIIGDRDGELNKLNGRKWDAVIDTCGYYPRVVKASAKTLAKSAKHYTFISTISVYGDLSKAGVGESSPVGRTKDETVEEIREDTYGPLKAICERIVQEHFPNKALVIRPGLIVGPYDLSDRFTYWVHRVSRGGKILAPKPENYQVQYIDVRDLSEWIIDLIEKNQIGAYNGIGPNYRLTMKQFLSKCRDVSQSDGEFIWVRKKFLKDKGVQGWVDLPIWIDDPKFIGLMKTDCDRAFKSGLKMRPLEDTIRDTLDWCRTRPEDYKWRAGLEARREKKLIKEWSAESQSPD